LAHCRFSISRRNDAAPGGLDFADSGGLGHKGNKDEEVTNMNNQVRLISALLFLLAAGAGCERDDGVKSTDEFYITPATAELVSGQAVTLTANGGHSPLVWTLSDPTAGQLSSSGGQSVSYLALLGTAGSGTSTNIVGGTSNTTAGVMNTITVTDDENWTASAVITQY
jgi:hypothetical protein